MIDNKAVDIVLLKDQIEVMRSQLIAMTQDRDDCLKLAKMNFTKAAHYEEWIREQGKVSNTCTFNILGEVCEDCACHRNKVANTGKTQFRRPYVAKEQGK